MTHKYTSTSRRLSGRTLQRVRRLVRQAQPICVECHKDGKYVAWDELDHIIPLHKGGTNRWENLQGLCRSHHIAKTAVDMDYHLKGACDSRGIPIDKDHHWYAG